ncbi:MAG: hypothetical protein EOM23_07975 [Candidatus Moranbacteria bacterium]|nr:hypothetical protein [Candidatus Moranbacteria bacterium]
MVSTNGEMRQLEYRFISEIKKILNRNKILLPYLITKLEPSSEDEDYNLSYDMIYTGRMMLSVRIRKNEYLRFKDFTIRSKSANGYRCEIDKLVDGLGDVYFYAWMDKNEVILEDWIVVVIDKIRDKLLTSGIVRSNFDGTMFRAYSIDFLRQNNALIAEKNQMKLF